MFSPAAQYLGGGGAASPQRRPTEKNAAEWYLAAMREARRRGREEWVRQCGEASSDGLDPSTNRQIRTAFTHLHDTIMTVPVQPALGLMLISEHVERTLPQVTQHRLSLTAQSDHVETATSDLKDAAEVLAEWSDLTQPTEIATLLARSIQLKQAINQREAAAAATAVVTAAETWRAEPLSPDGKQRSASRSTASSPEKPASSLVGRLRSLSRSSQPPSGLDG